MMKKYWIMKIIQKVRTFMKKYIITVLIAIMITSQIHASDANADSAALYDESICKALELIKDTWQAQAEESAGIMPEPYVNIKNTRIVKISEEPANVQMDDQPIEGIRAKYFMTDYSGAIDEIIDLNDAYNGKLFG